MYRINYRQHALYSIRTAIVVGFLLIIINHFYDIMRWDFTLSEASTWLLNFVVPFTVSFYSRVMSDRKTSGKKSKIHEEHILATQELEQVKSELDQFRQQSEITNAEEKNRKWSADGLARIGQIIREHEKSERIFDDIISTLVKVLGMNQGGIYLLREREDEKILELGAMYAYDRKKHQEQIIHIGQGLVGQCYLEKDYIHLTEIPEDYISITSGLGTAPPNTLFIFPLIQNDEVEGIVELGAFHPVKEHQINFLMEVGEVIASFVANHRINDQTKRLLRESQENAEELRIKEEQMRQSLEELEATQEDMKRKETEMEKLLLRLRNSITEQNLKEISVNVELGLRDAAHEINFLTHVPPIQGMIRAIENNGFDVDGNSSYEEWMGRFYDIICNLMNSKQLYNEVALLDPNKETLLSVVHEDGSVRKSKESTTFDHHFDKVSETEAGEIYFGEASVEFSGEFHFILAQPIFREGKLQFVLFMSLKTEKIMELIQDKEDSRNRYLITDSMDRTLYQNVNRAMEEGLKQSVSISDEYEFIITHYGDN